MDVRIIRSTLQNLADKKQACILQRFFKTGPGEYGQGDIFLGIRVPQLRKLARDYQSLLIDQAIELLISDIHEERLFALFILIRKYNKADDSVKQNIYDLYLKNTCYINNWDLVDSSAEHIVGDFLLNRSKKPLYILAESESLWERRISIMSTFCFIKHLLFSDTLKISEILMQDKHDLIHKAVGWMLREIGKRDLHIEEAFLKEHYRDMPRTMLRYAIEKFPESKRLLYLKGQI